MTLHDWFQYTDRDKSLHNPIIDTMITVDRFWQGDEKGKYDSPTWQKEEWLTHSILVPIEYLKILATKKIDPQELKVSIGWNLKGEFDFGEYLMNELRIEAAHIGNLNIDKGFNLMGISTLPSTPRIGWTLCVDSVIECLNNITNALK